jgi:hypothetical protein
MPIISVTLEKLYVFLVMATCKASFRFPLQFVVDQVLLFPFIFSSGLFPGAVGLEFIARRSMVSGSRWSGMPPLSQNHDVSLTFVPSCPLVRLFFVIMGEYAY